MTGKFNNSSNIVCSSFCLIIFPLVFISGPIIAVKSGLNETAGVFLVAILALVSFLLLSLSLLKKCEFSADDEKIVFRVAFPFLKLMSDTVSQTASIYKKQHWKFRRCFNIYELSFWIKVHGSTSEETSLPFRISTSFCAAILPMFLSS